MDLPFYREYELPWTTGRDQEKKFQRLLGIIFLICLVLSIVWPFIPVPEPDPFDVEEIPPRIAQLLLEEEPLPVSYTHLTLPNAKDMKLPESIAEKKPKENVVVLIGKTDILVQGEPVAKIADVMATQGNDIPQLREALLSQNDRALRRAAKEDVAGREVTIMGDKDISYRLLKKVMATCTASDYGQISLAVLQKSSDKLDDLQASL